jgi:hypothetical protein
MTATVDAFGFIEAIDHLGDVLMTLARDMQRQFIGSDVVQTGDLSDGREQFWLRFLHDRFPSYRRILVMA